ncbi:zf-HC2 domain-containing protein [Terrabacter sp. 2RAF25]|uniref:zf-HC2 domain-containing protein n=1 Tax=Terrabacter sp. 2RAF25 TaxID=3232998 RepID=UPI003F9D0D95
MVDQARDGLGGEPRHVVDDQTGEAVLAAWRSLPSASRALLWRLVIHDEDSPRIAPDPAPASHSTADPVDRARDRLRLGLLSELVARAEGADCAAARRALGAHLRGTPPGRDRTEVDDHLAWCAPCRAAAAVLDDVDGAIRHRVAPALLPGAFAADADVVDVVAGDTLKTHDALALPAHGAVTADADLLDPLDLLDRAAVRAAGATDPAAPLAARVLSVPGRGVLLVTAAAALALALTLFVLEPGPGGPVAAEAPAPRGQPVTSASRVATSRADGSGRAASGRRPVIGVAVAEAISGDRAAGPVPTGRLRRETTVDVRAVTGPARTPRASAAPSTGRTSSALGSAPTPARPSAPAGHSAPPPATVAPTPATPPTQPVVPPSGAGIVTTLTFVPAGRGTFVARLSVSSGWLVTSLVDEVGHRAVEHVTTPSALLEERMHAGRVAVEVTRVTDGARAGSLAVTFVGRADSVLPGSGTYALR